MRNTNIKAIFNHLLVTQLLLNTASNLCDIVGGYVGGNFLGSLAISSSSLLRPMVNLTLGIASVFSAAADILCGQYMGKGDKKAIDKSFTMTVVMSFFVGFSLLIISFVAFKPIVIFLGAKDPELYEATVQYLYGYAIGFPAYILFRVFSTYLHIENEGRYVTISVVLMAALYTGFSYLFIVIMGLDCYGYGLSNTLSSYCAVLFLFIRLIKNRGQIRFDMTLFDTSYIREIFVNGFAAGISHVLFGFRNVVLNNVLVATGGLVAVAAKSVFGSAITITDIITVSFTSAGLLIAGICVGEKNKQDLIKLYKYAFRFSIFVQAINVVLTYFLSIPISSIFSKDIETIALASHITRAYLPAAILEIISTTLINLYSVFQYKSFVDMSTFLHCFIFHVCFALATQSFLGYDSVFGGYIFTEVCYAIVIFVYICIKNKSVPKRLEDILLIPSDFDEVEMYNVSIHSYDEVANLSQGVTNFLLAQNVDSKRAKLSGLCTEEMASNIFEHGFSKVDKKSTNVDVLASVENDEISIRIRDNAIPYNPTTRELIFNPEDPCKNAGLKLVKNYAKEMIYQNLFDNNSMILKL